jgi:hypothetical protein
MWNRSSRIVATGLVSLLTLGSSSAAAGGGHQTMPVSGSGVHFFTTAIIHSQEAHPTGMTQRSTDVIQLTGDLSGYVLYHPISEFDYVSGTLVNTGSQFFSGTIAGSSPIILYDDKFRFEVDLSTGATVGEVHFSRSSDAPHKGEWQECHLDIVGTGLTAQGDATFLYSGKCTRRGR